MKRENFLKYFLLLLLLQTFLIGFGQKNNNFQAIGYEKYFCGNKKHYSDVPFGISLKDLSNLTSLDSTNADCLLIIGFNRLYSEEYILKDNTVLVEENLISILNNFNKSIFLDSTRAEAFYMRGRVKTYLKDSIGAKTDFIKAIKINFTFKDYITHDSVINYRNKVYQAFTTKNYREAIRISDKIIELDSTDSYTYFLRGQIKELEFDTIGADIEFSKAITYNKDFISIIYHYKKQNLTQYYWQKVEFIDNEEKLIILQKIIDLDSLQTSNAEYYYYKFKLKMEQRDSKGAENDFRKAIMLDSNYIIIRHNDSISNVIYPILSLANMNYENRNFNEALIGYSRVLEIDNTDFNSFYRRGKIKQYLVDSIGAISDYLKAIELYPEFGDVYFDLGLLYFQLKDYTNSISFFTSLSLSSDSWEYDVFYFRGMVKEAIKDFEGAKEDYTNSLSRHGYSSSFHYFKIGLVNAILKDYIGAIENYNNALTGVKSYDEIKFQSNTDFIAEIYFNKGLAEIELNQITDACADFKKAKELNSKKADAKIILYCK